MIVVTGASRGIGHGIAERLSCLGRDVLGVARAPADLPFPTQQVDVTDEDQIRDLAVSLRRAGTTVDALINCAGIASMNLALMTPPSVARDIVTTNLLGTIYCCQALAPLIARTGGGAIINFSSIAVALGLSGESVYAASKAGVEAYTRVLAREVAGLGIRANCIAPGPVETGMLRSVSPELIDRVVQRQVIRRPFTVDDVCDVVELLLDSRSRAISGQVLHVGGA